ncbi:DUF1932 domain-containing protein [Cryptosporangium phraense]|uniref:DUF1932 domain-containing protein n=1 Tax=Cryptosporangium phraense TaxID=2593070 RepID=A0A545AM69_9ACTN|nr:DUF1932 domain-containing protein [Cryptosporangium phraense]TQS42371.1 DUF1932 domain-containing protein [Cryptosporangium phraense]
MTVGVLHPGAMGAAIGRELAPDVWWVPAGRSAATRERAAGFHPARDLAELADRCDLILSICPPAFAGGVARDVAATGFDGVYVDANAISPARAREIASVLPTARVVDGGIIGPPPGGAGTTTLCLSGPGASGVAEVFAGTSVRTLVLDGPVGQASALKLAFASYNKISYALAAQANALAEAHGVLAELRTITADALPGTPVADPRALASVGPKAWRWAPEMEEIADACTEAGLDPDFAATAATLFARWA